MTTNTEIKMDLIPIFQKEAFEFIDKIHRHNKKPQGSVVQIGLTNGNQLIGVVILGRPINKTLQDGYTLEITRLATDGTKNACSKLYAAAWRAAKAIGYRKVITYILNTQPGTSLKASGWTLIGQRGGGTWNRPNRQRLDKHSLQPKLLYEIK